MLQFSCAPERLYARVDCFQPSCIARCIVFVILWYLVTLSDGYNFFQCIRVCLSEWALCRLLLLLLWHSVICFVVDVHHGLYGAARKVRLFRRPSQLTADKAVARYVYMPLQPLSCCLLAGVHTR